LYDSDEDDEADFSKMDQGGNIKRTQLTRFDFDDEEEFARYKDSQEAVPRAAFQYGVKIGDGRKKTKELTGKQKADKDYDQIANVSNIECFNNKTKGKTA